MRIIKSKVLILLLLVSAFSVQAQPINYQEQSPQFYVGLNPMALTKFFGNSGSLWNGLGFASGAESGLALYAGWKFMQAQSLEARISSGPANLLVWETQFQMGYIWYPCEQFLQWKGGPSLGVMIRNTAFYNTLNKSWTFNHVPELIAGWRFPGKYLDIDLRTGINISSFTWSTIAHSKPAFNWISLPYGCTFSLGMAFVF